MQFSAYNDPARFIALTSVTILKDHLVLVTIREQFEAKGFIVASTAYDSVDYPKDLRTVIDQQADDSPVAMLVRSYPDLFIYPRKSEPERGCLFAVVATDGRVPKDRRAALKRFFPEDRIAVLSEKNGTILAHWLTEAQSEQCILSTFIEGLV